MPYPKKLIEVALPLEAINKESAREKSIRHGHPSTLHLWWARRPLAAARAVLFSSLVDDPSEYIEDEDKQKDERERLFQLIEELVKWENINNDEVIDRAKLEIARSVARNLGEPLPVGKAAIEEFLAAKAPPVLDPFAGGGTIPLEAQRLGLKPYASDLNPVAVLINKALIEIPPKFADMPPVHPPREEEEQVELFKKEWKGAEGLAEDVRYYGQWMRDKAEKKIGNLYPSIKITQELLDQRQDLVEDGYQIGDELTVMVWLWARTVKCPNPACNAEMPLVRSFAISTRKGNKARVEPIIDSSTNPPKISFLVKVDNEKARNGTVNRGGARCLACYSHVPFDHVREEGQAGKLGSRLMAIVAEGNRRSRRVYFSPIPHHENFASTISTGEIIDTDLPEKALGFRVQLYGMTRHADLFTPRQLLMLSTLSHFVKVTRDLIESQTKLTSSDGLSRYSDSIAIYLAFSIDRVADKSSSLSWWLGSAEKMAPTFTRHALAMVWDYAEMNPFCTKTSNLAASVEWVAKVIDTLPKISIPGHVFQKDAREPQELKEIMVSTDPPYYDNIGYADLSDFFYVWLRLSVREIYPDLFQTMLVPKQSELIATPYRFNGDRNKAKIFFEQGLRDSFVQVRNSVVEDIPFTIFYAFKQVESDDSSVMSTGWETLLEGLLKAGFSITGTWPIRTERGGRMISVGTNALASSIVLVCRKRMNRSVITRRSFRTELSKQLPKAIRNLQEGAIAPVDMAQASIGPGMAVYSQYQKVIDADGQPMSVRSALAVINQVLDDFFNEQEGDFDSDTRWAVAWYEQFGHEEADYGVAETLSIAKNTSVQGLSDAGILESRAGKARLLRRTELEQEWNPEKDKRLTTWKASQNLIRTLDQKGEHAAAELLARLGGKAEPARELAYRLYTICERKGWAQDALGYNMLVVAWPRLKQLAGLIKSETQSSLF
jgi:putative DNA methylase